MKLKDFSVSKENWTLHRKGHLDQERHREKIEEAIKKNLADIVSEENIIMSEGKKVFKIPLRSLEEFRFRFDYQKARHAGQGSGDSKEGEILAMEPSSRGTGQGAGKGHGAGDTPGMDYQEAEVSLDELEEIVFENWQLPNLQEKQKQQVESESIWFREVRRQGLIGNLDKKRTILENLKRNALQGSARIGNISQEDLRFKTWEQSVHYQSNAVVLAMMDTSGSMGIFEKYIARSFFFWMVRFLRAKYGNVKILFLAHHVQAKEVTEEEFFSRGESGGTRCSSVYKLALKIIKERYLPQDYNLYPFHFSDGDNLPSDNETCVQLVRELLTLCNTFGYGEIVNPHYRSSTLMDFYKKVDDPKLVAVTIKEKSEVYAALKKFFS